MISGALADQLRELADALDTWAPTTDLLRRIQAAENALAAKKTVLVAEMIDHADHEAEGYSGPKAWMRDQLNLDRRDASRLIAAADTFRDLPDVMEAAVSGRISPEHVRLFGYSLEHGGTGATTEVVQEMLEVAQTNTPRALRGVVTKLRETVHPDQLEQAWIDGMARQDIRLSPVPEGFHVTGFVSNELGAKLRTLLHSLGTPRDAQDDRDTAERRVTGLERLVDAVLANGLPADHGVHPHLTLTVDLADLVANPTTATGQLAGFGTISNAQLKRMLEISDLTPILTGGKSGVLDVGRRRRFATERQKRGIDVRQRGRCAEEGCPNPIDHYHHVVEWSRGGLTDLDVLVGVCHRTHVAIHQGLLHVDPVTRQTRRVLRQVRRRTAA